MSTSQKQAARKFVEYWTFQRGSEKGEDQQFWNSLLRDVLGVTDVEQHIKYQVPVQLKDTTKFLDAWIPETRVLIEHKSRGVNLEAPQAGHGGLTPYEQAVEYDNARPFDEKARWIVTCNFDEFRIYDRAKPLAPPLTLKLGNLPKEAYRLAFLVNPKEKAIDRELEISVQAGRIVGEIYDALLKQYQDFGLQTCDDRKPEVLGPKSEVLAALNRLCVRLVFCLYAEDAEIFPKDCFRRLMENTPAPFLRERLKKLFEILDTPLNKRDVYLEPELCAFPYTNGGLFSTMNKQTDLLTPNGVRDSENVSGVSRELIRLLNNLDDIPPITDDLRQLLIGASQFDWREITPTIFGALFESTLNPVTRRSGGMVYTSVENIHKVIDPLFLSDLTKRVNDILGTTEYTEDTEKKASVYSVSSVVKKKLLALQDEMAALTFLDPACGSGNFLTETYICLRRLENRIIAALQQGQGELDLGISVKVSIAQFHGIEINDFAVAVAKTALWIAEAQMRRETAEILHREPDYLPLKDYDNIIEGNALRMDWSRIGLPTSDITIVSIPEHVPFRDAKAHLTELKNAKKEVANAAGERFRFTKQIFKALSDKARDQSVGREVHWAAVAAVERLCEASVFLWDEKPRNGSVDISRYAKHGVCFSVGGVPYIAKITSKIYPGDIANVTYSVEAVSIEKNDARGITDSISKGQGLDPSAANRVLHFAEAVKRATAKKHFSYIMGNPPFVGARMMAQGSGQKKDIEDLFGDIKDVQDLDYVCGWYKKAAAMDARCAFVSTNSICQGAQVPILWGDLIGKHGTMIDFAHQTFRWDNESTEKAAVHCVIVGFHAGGENGRAERVDHVGVENASTRSTCSTRLNSTRLKTLFDNGKPMAVPNISPYLTPGPSIFVIAAKDAAAWLPKMNFGNQPRDGGHFILSPEERDAILAAEPEIERWIRPYIGAEEFIKGRLRYCIWLKGASPADIAHSKTLYARVAAVKQFRLASKAKTTNGYAKVPHLFAQITQPDGVDYLVIPSVSSERRRYIPIGYMGADVIASNAVQILPNATLCHFGVLTSSVHMAWMRTVAGRLKSDYRYSKELVYNTFPWLDLRVSAPPREKIEKAAQHILDVRAKYPDCSFAELYDENLMPADLRAAHEANDKAVLAAYGLAPDTPEPEIVAHLFKLYANLTGE